MNITRRNVLEGILSGISLTLIPIKVTAQSIENIFRIFDEPKNPDNFTYDMFAWDGSGYLAFADGNDIARWGNDNPPSKGRDTLRFNELTNPDRITPGLASFIMSYLIVIAYIIFKLRNPLILVMWGFSIIVLILTFVTPLEFLWFWIMVILTVSSTGLVSIVRELI